MSARQGVALVRTAPAETLRPPNAVIPRITVSIGCFWPGWMHNGDAVVELLRATADEVEAMILEKERNMY